MKHKVSELTSALLDAAVAKATGDHWPSFAEYRADFAHAPYSSEWQFGGPLIEREHLWLYADPTASRWIAGKGARSLEPGGDVSSMTGPAPLIAAMRAYVASKLGDEVDL